MLLEAELGMAVKVAAPGRHLVFEMCEVCHGALIYLRIGHAVSELECAYGRPDQVDSAALKQPAFRLLGDACSISKFLVLLARRER